MLYSFLNQICDVIYKVTWNRITPDFLLVGILLFFLSAAFCLRLYKRGRLALSQVVVISLLLMYLFLLFSGTVFCRQTKDRASYILSPFWSYREAFLAHRATMRGMVVRNCLMLFPVGLLLPVCVKGKTLRAKTVTLVSLGISFLIELLQLILRKGTFELVDDPFNNLLGALLGYGIYSALKGSKEYRLEKRKEA